jgi:hypothetical protein
MDFLHDQLATGTKIEVLTVVDSVRRQSFWDPFMLHLYAALAL